MGILMHLKLIQALTLPTMADTRLVATVQQTHQQSRVVETEIFVKLAIQEQQ